ncbi:type I restriction enzyme HsdR N-terminal domain-containing protein [Mesorhizobium sp. B2-8-5]|uniref:type I restriction enzyme HsdR N-terminal domain-containing protein n=1 Tax=Mesorhizobium sp. B2-8-5 TaxID=2589903 RepID=UPI00112BAA74|nr:type I restriction enzyme HsdR N-terminal domain-containing protein [Mesorhizobium sp. B2-8-5]UCI26740.1 type I restriction enzyme HsdR N-terminal domain-containing protein [Mesorhizobium sp. B2-8-5]
MQAPFEWVEGRQRLKAILDSFPADHMHWSEAQNRFQFVDRLLLECLGWENPSIVVERPDGAGGRADYVLGVPQKAVVEVKREAISYGDLPPGKPSIVRKLEPLIAASKEFKSSIYQVISYCSLLGVPLAIVCNGPQLAIFQVMTPGQSPLTGECFFFNGFQSYLDDFTLLWTLLSPEGVSENRAYRQIALHRNPRLPEKASIAIAEPMKLRYRSEFQENLRALSSLLLEEIEDNPSLKPAFYRDCYVSTEANNRHLLLSKQIIAARYKRASTDASAPSALETAITVSEANKIHVANVGFDDSASSRPVVVIGDVGVGKTSFFENLFVSMDKDDRANTYFIHINLGIKANLARNLKDFILDEVPRVLLNSYNIDIEEASFVNSIYHEQLRGFDRGVFGRLKLIEPDRYERERVAFLSKLISSRDTHLLAALGHLVRGRRKQIILIIDNADQRDYATQQEAFLIAQELASHRLLLVFVALRPATFYESKQKGALSAYQNKILTISPPPADEVVSKRLSFAVRVAEGKENLGSLGGIALQLSNVVAFLRSTLRSITSNESIRQFLSNITGGNTRAVMELITGFCGSPNVDSRKIVEIELETGRYNVPLHEFTKHALLGEYAYYNPQSSQLACNIFDVSRSDAREHFLCSLVISFLSSNMGVRDSDGFVRGDVVIGEMLRHGFLEDQTKHAFRRLASKKLIETPFAHFRELTVADNFPIENLHYRATSVGIYHVRFWAPSFSFLDATSTDTPIFDNNIREQISKLASSFDIRERLLKAELFRQYLEEQWHLANLSPNYYDFPSILRSQDSNFEMVRSAAHKTKSKSTRRRFNRSS